MDQVRSGLLQAKAAEKIIDIQLEKTSVTAPAEGTILINNLTVGELVGAGTVAMTIAQLDEVSLVVYVPEDVYGLIQLNQKVSVEVDSYPNKTYPGQVVSIAQEAEFTPRNVQTVEGRKSTVFAIEIRIENPNNELKPGMPADVDFGILYWFLSFVDVNREKKSKITNKFVSPEKSLEKREYRMRLSQKSSFSFWDSPKVNFL